MKKTTGRLTEKNNKWYAVINLYNEEGKRKEKWINLGLDTKRGNKTEATIRLGKLLTRYNTSDLYLHETLSRAERERIRIANQPVHEYMTDWLDSYKCNISILTYNRYLTMIKTRIVPYFKKLNVSLIELTGDEINDFYIYLRNDGLTGATTQRYHSIMHLAFKHAIKRRLITSNPCDQAERPKANQYIGTYYNVSELKQLLDCLEGDPMRVLIILTAYYGLRRSEVLGLKWDAIDFVENKIYIRHKIIENKLEGSRLEGYDVMKNKSSYRALPLIPYVKEILLEERARQEETKALLRKAYSKKYIEYVCVDNLGNLIKPQYVTEHFKVILERNGLKVIRFHDLRHSCASMLLANGVPMKMIQDWLGHSDMNTTVNVRNPHTNKMQVKAA